ncbi:hypothetical protein HYY73_02760 [Candidatus Woesearchaeota archaeon]|nr:hypothetical protein [Candidatus Woesearchaeota archaeon]
MATITVNVDDEVYGKFRKLASEEHNGKKGFLGDAITDAMKKVMQESEVEAARQRLREKLRRGYNLGGMKEGFKREDLYER